MRLWTASVSSIEQNLYFQGINVYASKYKVEEVVNVHIYIQVYFMSIIRLLFMLQTVLQTTPAAAAKFYIQIWT